MNEAIFTFFYALAHKSTTLDALMVFIAQDLVWVVLVVTFFYLLKHKDKKIAFREIGLYFVTAGAAFTVATILKNLFHTLRPFVQLQTVQPLISETSFAFPSGHAALLVSIAAFLWGEHRRAAVLVGSIGLLVGLSRIAVGVHWPIDIAGGILLGVAIGVAVYHFSKKILPSR